MVRFRSLTKLAIGGGAVYATVSEGVWNTSHTSCKALDRVRTSVLPSTSEYISKVCSYQYHVQSSQMAMSFVGRCSLIKVNILISSWSQ